ncbi:MAG: VCBS repeat-containing protein, partial [Myxococcales bacterium]|nr:VCBS repeat-containing protein [Myxococcales bacterium]
MRSPLALLLLSFLAGCGDDAAVGGRGPGGAGGAGGEIDPNGGSTGGGAPPECGSASPAPLDGSPALVWDDGVAETNLREQSFQITADNKSFTLNDEALYEAVRFDLEHPARVVGFTIHWAALPDDPNVELEAGLYRDFGHNGFDFWAPQPLFTGTRCVGDIDEEGWLSYAFDEPIEIAHPGLVYVAHRAEPGSPVWSFDGSEAGDGSCALFADCHSALNLPDALASSYFNGLSFPFQYDYLVRLHYEYLEEIEPADRLFQPVDFTSTAHASFGDYDGDGDDDIVTDGPKLWQNQGDGSFIDASADAGLVAAAVAGTGGVFGDYDNDGCLDLFVYAESYTVADTLLHNECNGTFTDVTAAAGIVDLQTYETCNDPGNVRSPTAAAAWVDLDADGLLDLYLANFICWDKGTTYVDTVWHNLGAGVFEDWTSTHGFGSLKRASRGANPIDVEGDGDVDVLVNNYRLEADQYWENLGGGQFDETAADHGVAGTLSQGYYGHTIGTAFGDLDEDGDFDLVSANLAHPRF